MPCFTTRKPSPPYAISPISTPSGQYSEATSLIRLTGASTRPSPDPSPIASRCFGARPARARQPCWRASCSGGWNGPGRKVLRSTIGIGASNYNAIDNLLTPVLDLLEHRNARRGEPPIPTRVVRVRSSYSQPPSDPRPQDVERSSGSGRALARELEEPTGCTVVGGTWMQLEKLAKNRPRDPEGVQEEPVERPQVARWFDLLLIDEASQVGVAPAAAYFLLLKESANVVLAGDHRQLGPIYGFQMDDSEGGLFECIFTYAQDTHGAVRTSLDTNYRTNEEIAAWPRERFYGEGYEAFHPRRRLELRLPPPAPEPPYPWPEGVPWSEQFVNILDPALPVAVVTYEEKPYTRDLAMKALHISVPPLVEKLAASIRMWHASDPL